MKEDIDLIKEYNDVELNRLITDCKNVTLTLSSMKIKKRTAQVKELLILRRNRFGLIRKRATELNLTEADLNSIHEYIQI